MISIILIFLVVGGYLVYEANNLSFKESDDRKTFLVEFASWLKDLFNTTKDVAGYAISHDWMPNATESKD